MNIPVNGRIAIVDDNLEQALPLMELFGKSQFPFLYYSGSLGGLPEDGAAINDIRILFLDIYLTGDQTRSEKEIKASLIPVLNRIISANNYPYILIFWSRHEKEHGKLIEDIFKNELKAKSPITFLSLNKSDYFELTGEKTKIYTEKIPELIDRIKAAVNKYPVYGYLMAWENLIHNSTDKTLEEIFRSNQDENNWDLSSNYLFDKLGNSFLGKNYKASQEIEKIKSSFYSLNFVFNDSLEYLISSDFNIANVQPLDVTKPANPETVYFINKKLLFADESKNRISPGIVSADLKSKHNYPGILNSAILRNKLFEKKNETICEKLKGIAETLLKKAKKKIEEDIFDQFKTEIKSSWVPIECNVTPICDFVQGKEEYSRILPGLLIHNKYRDVFDSKTEALFISPDFGLTLKNEFVNVNGIYFMLLDFRFLTSIPKAKLVEEMNPILRVRQLLLTEIQSKLSRHINRQGILFLEE